MKAFSLGAMLAMACLAAGPGAQAQYKSPRDYFPKNNPAPGPGGQPASPRATAPQQPKFKDLSVNSQFYFLSDTNRTYAWMKLSPTTAKNTKNGVTQMINAETPVQR